MKVFKESQKFDQWWIWIFLIPLGLFPLVGIYQQIIRGEPFGSNPMSDTMLIIVAIFIIGFVWALYSLTLKTEIDSQEIRIKFGPLAKKTFRWSDIEKSEVIKYGFVGGWGIRIMTKYGTVYNVRGFKGLALQMKDGKKFLIGTQKEDALKQFLSSIGK